MAESECDFSHVGHTVIDTDDFLEGEVESVIDPICWGLRAGIVRRLETAVNPNLLTLVSYLQFTVATFMCMRHNMPKFVFLVTKHLFLFSAFGWVVGLGRVEEIGPRGQPWSTVPYLSRQRGPIEIFEAKAKDQHL